MMKPQTTTATDFGKIAYDAHWEFTHCEHPRLGMRTATWDELGDRLQGEWRKVAKSVITAFAEQVVKDVF